MRLSFVHLLYNVVSFTLVLANWTSVTISPSTYSQIPHCLGGGVTLTQQTVTLDELKTANPLPWIHRETRDREDCAGLLVGSLVSVCKYTTILTYYYTNILLY